jgi:hypothetical protein
MAQKNRKMLIFLTIDAVEMRGAACGQCRLPRRLYVPQGRRLQGPQD